MASSNSSMELRPIRGSDESARLLDNITPQSAEGSKLDLMENALPLKLGRSRRSSVLFEGWKFTLFLASVCSLVVLSFNMGFMIYAAVHPREDDSRVIFEGDCEKSKRMNTGIHFLVNLLSTTLLSASNFGMQCLSSPTRHNIDQAHKESSWLNIGVPSVRNLFFVSKERLILWLLLAISSLPFHLFYNSAIYYTIAVPAYDIFAGPDFRGSANQSQSTVQLMEHIPGDNSSSKHSYGSVYNFVPILRQSKAKDSLLELWHDQDLQNLSTPDCISHFGTIYQTEFSKLLLVTDDAVGNDSYVHVFTNPLYNKQKNWIYSPDRPATGNNAIALQPFSWICPFSPCYPEDVTSLADKDNWTVTDFMDRDHAESSWSPDEIQAPEFRVKYCLAMKTPQKCKLRYSLLFTMLVIASNVVKSGILIYMWIGVSDVPLLTLGDSIASFLRHPDPHTNDACLLSSSAVSSLHRSGSLSARVKAKQQLLNPEKPLMRRKFWGSASSKKRWALGIVLWIFGATFCFSFFVIGAGVDNVWKSPLEALDYRQIIAAYPWPSKSFVLNVLIANSPQVMFSFIYFTSNSILTSMCIADEWSRFAISPKGLRVSNNPQLAQRSNYFLSVPYRYGIPLMILSAILHWLIAESLFVVAVEAFDALRQRKPSQDVYNCAYSLVAISCGIGVSALMFLSLLGLGFRKFKSSMPVAGSNSLAIAAACHPKFNSNIQDEIQGNSSDREINPDEEVDMALLPVQWGAIPTEGPIGHCSFTSGYIEPLEEGREYQ